jgi:hypothetical protein
MRLYDTAKPSVFGLVFGGLATGMACAAYLLTYRYDDFARAVPDAERFLAKAGVPAMGERMMAVAAGAAVFFLAIALLAFVRCRLSLFMSRAACWFAYALFFYGVDRLTRVATIWFETDIPMEGKDPSYYKVELFYTQWDLVKWYILAVLAVMAVHLMLHLRRTINLYTGRQDTEPAIGDRILENLRTHGADPAYRKSWWLSITAHAMVMLIIPWLLTFVGCVEPYRVPKGSGNPVVALVKVVKPQPKKKKPKKYILRMDTAIIFHIPDLDESEIHREVKEMTEVQYKTDKWVANARAGKMGAGGGTEGGWPLGMDQGKVRFIRLEHRGAKWDDGMDPVSRADMNFLDEFKKLTGFKIGERGECHPIRLLAKYDKGYAPPFVYLTGEGGLDIPERDMKILRDYLMDGGMLFVDCGSPQFGQAFRRVAPSILPGERLVEIADDDPLFQEPFAFPNGAPPLWHHDGSRALGMKYKGRWAVFYHPGDVNDAWKTGHSAMRKDLAEGAFQMGINVVYYSFTRYLELTRKYRKK